MFFGRFGIGKIFQSTVFINIFESGYSMSLQLATIHTMLVDAEVEDGYVLTKGVHEVFIFNKNIKEELRTGQLVDVFLYRNKEERLEASTYVPNMVLGSYGWAKVVDIFPNLGVFVDIGTTIDVLVPKDDLPFVSHAWPHSGDELYVSITLDRQERLLGVLAKEDVFRD